MRGEGKNRDGTRWVHIGTNDTYIALGQAKADSNRHWMPYSGEPGVNHLAYEVDDVESLRATSTIPTGMTGNSYSTSPRTLPSETTMSCPTRSAERSSRTK